LRSAISDLDYRSRVQRFRVIVKYINTEKVIYRTTLNLKPLKDTPVIILAIKPNHEPTV
jgi:hypothetical protein